MTLADGLLRVPADDREAIAAAAGLDAGADPPVLAAALARPERIAAALAALPAVARDALALLALGFDGQADRNALTRELGRMHPVTAGEALGVLERAGLVLPRTANPWLCAFFDETAPAARAAVAGWLQTAADPWLADVQASPAADPWTAVADVTRLLAAMADGIRVRQGGGIFQVEQRRLAQVFDRSLPPLPAPAFRGWTDYASEGLACHLALAMQLDLLETGAGIWRASPEVEVWVDMPPGRQWGELARAWLDLAALRLGGRLQALLGPFAGGRWVDFVRWRARLARFVHTYPPLAAAADAVFLRPGLLLGAIARGRAGGRDAFRLTEPALAVLAGTLPEPPPPAERVLVGADFEVVVPPGAPPRVVWDLGRWARLIRSEGVARYRITKETVRARSRTGEAADLWLGELGAAARFGVPENVRVSVLEWAVPAKRASMRPVVALRFPQGLPEGWSPPAGAQRAGTHGWLLDLPAAVREAAALRRAGVAVDGVAEEWTAMERARQEHRRRAGPAPLSLPWPGPLTGDPRTPPWMEAEQ